MRHSLILASALAALIVTTPRTSQAAPSLWTDVPAQALDGDGPRPTRYRSLILDRANLQAQLTQALASGTPFSLPHPDGGFTAFTLEDSGTLPAELAGKYPQLLSLRGDAGNGIHARIDVSELGFQAMVFDPDGTWLVQPNELGGGSDYVSFARADSGGGGTFQCSVHERSETLAEHLAGAPSPQTVTGANRKVLRTAIAATGEYTAKFGGTVSGGLAAIVAAVNRVNEVYGNEFSVTLQLVANNDTIVYTNGTTDPYTNNSGSTMLGENQTNLTSVIGSANYDLGHVFSTGGGGVASLNSVCSTSSKARGVTGSSNPTGDPFWIDYVAHEMGHQFGGNHTFNSTTSSCGGNRSSGAAYETGSGTTIQGYAGICGSDNTQSHSDPIFHARSLEEMQARINAIASCGTTTTNPSAAPVIPAMTTSYVIPARTPFELVAPLATDADGDALTYLWEEWDLGAATTIGVDNGSSPIARSFTPAASRTRTIPRLSNLLANTLAPGEILPTMDRAAMKFRLTVRDNHAGGGRTSSADLPGIRVVAAAGPFAVTAPNTAVSWSIGIPNTVTWDVAGTTAAPVSCANVDIRLSKDGGNTWAVNLATAVPNTGSASVTAPAGSNTTQARVRVQCTGNIFFDISNVNFSVVASSDVIFANGFQSP